MIQAAWKNKWAFFATFFVVFIFTYIVLLALDFYPEPISSETATSTVEVSSEQDADAEIDASETTEPTEEVSTTDTSNVAILPTRIEINRLDREIEVLNPNSRAVADLDAALLEGVVRHPDSAALNQEGNLFILGHSSYLPNVFNKNFQAFNGIQDLEWGDIITVYSDDMVYEYRVEKVYRARANELTVPIAGTGNRLTLATCNSFGSVDDRYIVEAERTGTRSL